MERDGDCVVRGSLAGDVEVAVADLEKKKEKMSILRWTRVELCSSRP